MDKENRSPLSKKKKLSLSLKKNRFQPIEKADLDELSTPHVPKNTSVMTRWAIRNLKDWFDDHNRRNAELPCPDDILSPSCDAEILNDWLMTVNDSGSNNNTVMPCNPIESTETKPEMYASPSTNSPVYSSAAGQQYNNCTVNIFAPPDNTYFPYPPPPPPPFW